jgi:3-keto-disaccharide hydrolase
MAAVVLLSGWMARGGELVLDFRQDKPNQRPHGFRSSVGGSGDPGEWRVLLEDAPSLLAPVTPLAKPIGKRPVLAQLSRDRTDEHFPMLVYEQEMFGDFTLTTRIKLVEGEAEQMAGIAFRLRDERNYYYVRASALGGTFGLFKVLRGHRVEPPLLKSLPIAKGVWHEITVECKGTVVRASFNGQPILSYDDRSEAFLDGKIAYWTKSDSVSYFTDTVLTYKPKETLAQTLVRDALTKYPRLLGLKIYAAGSESGSAAGEMRIVASADPQELGQAAPAEAEQVLAKRGYYYGKGGGKVMLTLPLHDNSGEKVAAVRVVMKSFPGQTEKNAVARAMPVVQGMEMRIQTLKDLIQ